LSFVALCGFALFAMGTSKAKEEGDGGGSTSSANFKLKGSCDLIQKTGMCVEFDDSLVGSLACGMLGEKDSWHKDQPCATADVVAKCLIVDKKNNKQIQYYNKSQFSVGAAKAACKENELNKDSTYTLTLLVPDTDTAPSASAATSASAGGGGGTGGGGGGTGGGGGGGGGKATATPKPSAAPKPTTSAKPK
jgi:hypothetical protein